MITAIVANPGTLWALLNTSPMLALAAEDDDGICYCPTFRRVMEMKTARAQRDGYTIAAFAALSGEYAYHFIRPQGDISPDSVRAEVLMRGLHHRAAAIKDVFWRAENRPVAGFVVVAVHGEADHAEYVLGDELEAAGEAAYRASLARLADAVRDGWPGWRDRAPQVLE